MRSEESQQPIFDVVPVGLWRQDWTAAIAEFRQLASRGIHDSVGYYKDHPDALHELLAGMRTLDSNERCREMFQGSEVPEAPESLAAVLGAEAQQTLIPHIAAIADGATRCEQDIRAHRATGEPLWLHMTVCVLDPQNERLSVLVTLLDASEIRGLRKRVDSLTERLRQSVEEREQFTYAASHDLQEPLRMVASYAQLLDKRYGNKLDGRADKYINYIVDGAKRMQSLLGGLLQLSRIGDERVSAEAMVKEPVALNDLVDRSIQTKRSAIDACAGQITRGDLPTVSGYRWQLAQVFEQLFDNSIKFRRPDLPPRVHVAAERRADEWLLTVTDNGIGIAQEHASDIFVIFRRLHKRGAYPGNGIGLPLAKKIVEYHQGRIWLQQRPDHGASICFTLPTGEV